MKRILAAALFLSGGALAQAPPPFPNDPAKPPDIMAVTIDAQTYQALMTFLGDVPLKYSGPISGVLQMAQQKAQADAARAGRAKPEAK